MSSDHDEFLRDLQRQCLNECREHLDGYLAAINGISKNPSNAIVDGLKFVHSIKGNVQAAGFLEFGKFLHELETEVGEMETSIHEGLKLSGEELSLFEFLLSATHTGMASYLRQLEVDFKDSVDLLKENHSCLDNFKQWRQDISGPLKKSTLVVGKIETAAMDNEQVPEPTKAKIVPTISPEPEIEKPLFHTYLLCRAGGGHYAVDVSRIIEIASRLPLTALPWPRKDVRGLINLRGETVSILSLESVFGKLEKVKYMIICEYEGRSFGFEVEDAEQIMPIYESDVQELPMQNGKRQYANSITHVANLGQKHILILNLEKVLVA